MSSLIFRNAVIKACFPAFKDHEFDTDRTLAVELSRQGDVFFHDTPSIVVRQHFDQESSPEKYNEAQVWIDRNTRRMIQQARDSSIDLQSELLSRFSRPEFTMTWTFIPMHTFEILATESLLPPNILTQYRNHMNHSARVEADSISSVEAAKKWKTRAVKLQKTVDSALRWQQRSWIKRAFHRWRPPGWEKNKKSFSQKLKEFIGKLSSGCVCQ